MVIAVAYSRHPPTCCSELSLQAGLSPDEKYSGRGKVSAVWEHRRQGWFLELSLQNRWSLAGKYSGHAKEPAAWGHRLRRRTHPRAPMGGSSRRRVEVRPLGSRRRVEVRRLETHPKGCVEARPQEDSAGREVDLEKPLHSSLPSADTPRPRKPIF